MKAYVLRPNPAIALTKEIRQETEAGSRVSATGPDSCQHLSKGERGFLKIVENESGREISPEAFAKKKAERDLLMAQSVHIAGLLESVGVNAYGEANLTMVGLVSGIEEPLIDFRNIVFIPAVAKRKRNKVLGDLEFFIQNNRFSRMWVFTSGARCPIGEVAERIKEMHRRISKLNGKPFMKAAGISIVFRATELGSLVRADGTATFHIHSHVIVHLERRLGKDAWSCLLGKVREWWQFHFADAKQIQMAREACKYVVKPGDLLHLSGAELKALYEQLFKLHLVQALGPLRDQRRDREDTNQRFHRVASPLGSKLEIIPNWNTRPAAALVPGLKPSCDTVLATLVPGPYFTRFTEPVAIILNRSKAPLRFQSARLGRICQAARAAAQPPPGAPGGASSI